MTAGRIVYAQGRPYGAPLTILRGGAFRRPEVKAAVYEAGFRWNGTLHGYERYAVSNGEFADQLRDLRDRFGVEVVPKDGLRESYVVDLGPDGPTERGENR